MATKKKAAAELKMVPVLRTCGKGMVSHGGFVWPTSGRCEAPDWRARKVCGQGLHGLLRGEGDGSLLDWSADAVWMVVMVDESTVVELDGKVKFPWAEVALVGDRAAATARLVELGCDPARIVGGTATAGYGGTATAGYGGTATAGYGGTATAGYGGTATAGDRGTATAGDRGTATAGDGGTATAGHRGTATAGDGGTATAGDGGTATAGDRGTATAGDRGTATAGYGGILNIRWWCRTAERYRIATFYVGEDGIEPNVPYRTEAGKPERVK